MPENMLGRSSINLTTLQDVFENVGKDYKLETEDSRFPNEDEIMIFNQSRLRINFGKTIIGRVYMYIYRKTE